MSEHQQASYSGTDYTPSLGGRWKARLLGCHSPEPHFAILTLRSAWHAPNRAWRHQALLTSGLYAQQRIQEVA